MGCAGGRIASVYLTVQHIAHDLMEKRGKSESNAIQMAVGIVKRWARGGGNVDSGTQAAARKAVAEWEAKKASAHAKVQASLEPWFVDELALREAALERVAVYSRVFGGPDGLVRVLADGAVAESAGDAKLGGVGSVLRMDLQTLSGLDIPPLARVQEARRQDPFDLVAEAFHPDELRGFGGKWIAGGGHDLRPSALPARSTRPSSRLRSDARRRYEGGVTRMSGETRSRLMGVFTAKERGQGKAPQPHKDLGSLYKVGKAHQSTFEKVLNMGRGIAQRMGARVQSTASAEAFEKAKRDVQSNPNVPHVIVAAMKGQKRAGEKVDKKYGGDASRLTDLVRGTLLVPHVDDLHKAIEHLRAELPSGWSISHPENQFVQGRREDKVNVGDKGGSGYRDIAVLLRAPDGFQAELQINTTHMWLAKEVEGGHTHYETIRALNESADHEQRKLTQREQSEVRRAMEAGRQLYDRAMIRSTRRAVPKSR